MAPRILLPFRFQFSLKAVFAVLTASAVGISSFLAPAFRQARAVRILASAGVAGIDYDIPLDRDDPRTQPGGIGAQWIDYSYNVTGVRFPDPWTGPRVDFSCLKNFPRLSVLYLRGYPCDDADIRAIAQVESLRDLWLDSPISDAELTTIAASLSKLESIIVNGERLTDQGLRNLSSLRSLESLTIWGGIFTGSGLEGTTTLKYLCLADCRLSADAITPISRMKRLEKLLICDSSISAIDGLGNMPKLYSLDLWGSPIIDEGLEAICSLAALRFLGLGRTAITDEALATIGQRESLETLDLAYTRVTDPGLAQVASLRNLKTLYLYNTAVTDAGLDHLRGMRQLQIVNADDTQVTTGALETLLRESPSRTAVLPDTP